MKKAFSSAFLTAIIISGLILVGTVHFGSAQDGLVVTITSDTTWAKESSPIVFSGPVVVSTGVTLTINAGVTVNLNGYPLFVNGTLKAIGSASGKIQISGGDISYGDNSQVGVNSIFENAVLNSTIKSSKPLTLNNNTIYAGDKETTVGDTSAFNYNFILGNIKAGSSTTISNNNINGSIFVGDFCTIFNNTVFGDTSTGTHATVTYNNMTASKLSTNPSTALTASNSSEIANNTITGGVSATSSTISNNVISGGFPYTDWSFVRVTDSTSAVEVYGNSSIISNTISGIEGYGILIRTGYTYISGNVVSRSIRVAGDALIEDNLITNSGTGIQVGEIYVPAFYEADYGHGNSIIRNNLITGNSIGVGSSYEGGSATVEQNLISNNTNGIYVSSEMTILNNTITNSSIAIQLQVSSVTIAYNNIINYTQNSLYLSSVPTDVNATYNWWGTADTQAIGLTIHDSKYDYNLGTVNVTPFLTEQNPAVPEFTPTIQLTLLIATTLAVAVGFKRKTRISFKEE
jgi:hypothetical protein